MIYDRCKCQISTPHKSYIIIDVIRLTQQIHVDLPKFKGVPYHITEINNKDFQIAHCNIKDWKRYIDWKPKTNRDINF